MNELSKKLVMILPKINKTNKEIAALSGEKFETIRETLYEAKIFYAFDNSLKSSDKKKTKSSTDEKASTDGSSRDKSKKIWSIKDISKMSTTALNKMVFTFNKRLSNGGDLTDGKNKDSKAENIDIE